MATMLFDDFMCVTSSIEGIIGGRTFARGEVELSYRAFQSMSTSLRKARLWLDCMRSRMQVYSFGDQSQDRD